MNNPCTISGQGLSYECSVRMKTIPLTKGYEAIVDNEDHDLVSQYTWQVWDYNHRNIYATATDRTNGKKTIRMHRLIMNPEDGMEVDHINGNGLDNQRENLRVCSVAENRRNRRSNRNSTSRFVGVSYDKWRGERPSKWAASIGGKRIGYFKTEKEAAQAYDRVAKEKYGEFANLNFSVLKKEDE